MFPRQRLTGAAWTTLARDCGTEKLPIRILFQLIAQALRSTEPDDLMYQRYKEDIPVSRSQVERVWPKPASAPAIRADGLAYQANHRHQPAMPSRYPIRPVLE